ncbi:MAG: DUF4229 domain-containing protein [Rothia sp. (in: high G+C Gram-positive bacteria)]|nr:DUF4229 domain-containing protein [Rothia sp. (in: high G+C Gram-positive bacteria)]
MNFLKYSILRLLLLVIAFYVCYWLNVGLILSGIFAVLIAFAISYLAFPRLHVAAGEDLQRWFGKRKKNRNKVAASEDTAVEDDFADQQRHQQGLDF